MTAGAKQLYKHQQKVVSCLSAAVQGTAAGSVVACWLTLGAAVTQNESWKSPQRAFKLRTAPHQIDLLQCLGILVQQICAVHDFCGQARV